MKTNNGPVLQPPQGGKGMLDKAPADSGSRESALSCCLKSCNGICGKTSNIFGGLWDL